MSRIISGSNEDKSQSFTNKTADRRSAFTLMVCERFILNLMRRVTMKNLFTKLVSMCVAIIAFYPTVFGAQVSRTAAGANPAAIQATVDQFRADLGGSNNGVGGSFTSGRREINWDGVSDAFSAPNFLP